jgi:hypothetical protein
LDRFSATFFCALAIVTLLFAVLMAAPREGLVDGIAPSFLLVFITWPQYYLLWRLYGHRRRQQIAECEQRGR